MIKLFLFLGCCCYIKVAFISEAEIIQCYDTDNASPIDCDTTTSKKCFGPKWTDYVGYAKNAQYTCSTACTDTGGGTDSSLCDAGCATDNCNKVDTTEFYCFTWSYSGGWSVDDETTCTIKTSEKDEKMKCNQPKDATTASDAWTAGDQCGPCGSGEGTTCTTTDRVDYECDDYTYASNEWTKGVNKKTCYAATDEQKCKLPADLLDETEAFDGEVCGECAVGEDNCKNGTAVASISFILAALAALLNFM